MYTFNTLCVAATYSTVVSARKTPITETTEHYDEEKTEKQQMRDLRVLRRYLGISVQDVLSEH